MTVRTRKPTIEKKLQTDDEEYGLHNGDFVLLENYEDRRKLARVVQVSADEYMLVSFDSANRVRNDSFDSYDGMKDVIRDSSTYDLVRYLPADRLDVTVEERGVIDE